MYYSLQGFTNYINNNKLLWATVESRTQVKKNDRKSHIELNSIFFRNGYSSTKKIGNLVEMLNSIFPCSLDEWENYYRYRSEQAGLKGILTEISYDLWRISDFKYSQDRIFAFVITRVIDETYKGVQTEFIAKALIQQHWGDEYIIRHATAKEDKCFSIDFIVQDGKSIVAGYQVKPDSFFSSKSNAQNNKGLIDDRIRNCEGMMNLAYSIDDFESVSFLKEGDIELMNYNPISVSFFSKDGLVSTE